MKEKIARIAIVIALATVMIAAMAREVQASGGSRQAEAQPAVAQAIHIQKDQPSYSPQATESPDDARVLHTRLQIILGLVGEVWEWLVLAIIAFGGMSPRLRDLTRRLTGGKLGSLGPFIVTLSALLALVSAPITFYSGYVIEHEFGLSNQNIWGWLSDWLKSLGVNIVGTLIIFGVVYWLVHRFPRRWWLYGALVTIVFAVVMGALMPVLITPLFNKFEPLQDQVLKSEILAQAQRGGVQVADVIQMDMSRQTNAANAYFIGLGPTKRIVLGDTLLANFTHEEVLTIVAHEMGHQVHQDIWRGIGVGAIFFLAGFYALFRIAGPLVRRFQNRLGFSHLDDCASLPLALLLVGLLFFIAQPAENTFSRYIEHEADRYALELTHQNKVYARALDKLGRINVSDPNPPGWMEFLFYTHPSLKERIEFAETYHPWENKSSSVPVKGR